MPTDLLLGDGKCKLLHMKLDQTHHDFWDPFGLLRRNSSQAIQTKQMFAISHIGFAVFNGILSQFNASPLIPDPAVCAQRVGHLFGNYLSVDSSSYIRFRPRYIKGCFLALYFPLNETIYTVPPNVSKKIF